MGAPQMDFDTDTRSLKTVGGVMDWTSLETLKVENQAVDVQKYPLPGVIYVYGKPMQDYNLRRSS